MFLDFSLINMQTLPLAFAGRVLNTVGEGFALAALSWLVLRVAKTRSATARFAVWFSTLLAVVLTPLLARQASAGTTGSSHFELASSWATYLFATWAVIAGMLLVRLAGSLWHVRQLRRACREMDAESGAALFETIEQHPCGRRVKLLLSDDVRIPTALGFLTPSIVLPSWTLAQLSAQELKVILLHELAHLRRHDDWTNLIQKVLKAVFFFHPAVWWIEGKLNLEREMACDDLVLDQTGSAKSYAASLISVAEKALSEKKRLQRTLVLAQSALGRVRQTSRRIAEILDPSKTKQTSSWRPAMAVASGLLVLVLVATPYAPEMISFKAAGAEMSAESSAPGVAAPATNIRAIEASARIPEPSQQPILAYRNHAGIGVTPQSTMIPARAPLRGPRKPKVVLASNGPEQRHEFVLVMRSTNFVPSGSAFWTLCVWRVDSSADGSRRIEETIVMNS